MLKIFSVNDLVDFVMLFLLVKRLFSGSWQWCIGGFVSQVGFIDILDCMFLGGCIQFNFFIVQEEDNESVWQLVFFSDFLFSQIFVGVQEGGSLEVEVIYQLVILVMDFLSYFGVNKGLQNLSFVKIESYEIIQMSYYFGVFMGYDIKVGEFIGNFWRLRYIYFLFFFLIY